jgi:hypothetical protein
MINTLCFIFEGRRRRRRLEIARQIQCEINFAGATAIGVAVNTAPKRVSLADQQF